MTDRFELRAPLIAVLGALACVQAATACDTPVYRYAMYRWSPAPFRVYFFHRGEPGKEDADVNRLLAEQSTTQPAAANLALETINVDQKDQLEQLPEAVKKAWEKLGTGKLPIHLVFTSWGDEVAAERLDAAAVRALVESPARKKIAELLEKRHAAVFLLLCGGKAAENQRAEKAAQEAIAQAAKAQLPSGDSASGEKEPMDQPAKEAAKPPAGSSAPAAPGVSQEDAYAAPQRLTIGLVKVDRSDPAERWLVRTLSTVERDMPQVAGLPMVFPVFGRGRVLAPAIGEGITSDNLCRQIALLAGACSCTVKAQNPGVDLLFRWDWESVAESMAAEEREAESREVLLPSGPESPQGSAPAASQATVHSAAAAGAGSQADGTPGLPGKKSPPVQEVASAAPVDTSAALADASAHAAERHSADSFATSQVWKYGIGLAVVAAAVLVVGFVIVRRQ